jgi:hypothetical protein
LGILDPRRTSAERLRVIISIAMSKRELIVQELERLPEQDLDQLLAFLHALREASAEYPVTTLAAESALADRLSPEEDAAWTNL